MGVIEKIAQMRNEGMSDEDISEELKEQRVSPASINDAFNQIKVKEAVSGEEDSTRVPSPNDTRRMENQGQFYQPRTKDIESQSQGDFQLENPNMQQQDYYDPNNYSQQTSEYSAPQPNNQEYYPQQYNYEEYQPQGNYGNTDSMIEVAEQVFSEKTKEIQKQIETLTEFATLAENKIENNTERIKRIEKIMDNLQIKILEKVGSYGDNLENVKKEMNMMQESFSKVLPELAEAKQKEHKK